MKYTNPPLPEGINASREHPLKEFFWLVAGVAAGLLLLLAAFGLLVDRAVEQIPFAAEQRLVAGRLPADAAPPPLHAYLNELAGRIAVAEGLPAGMTITVHYADTDVVNAFATLGGNVVMFRGLLEALPNENALAMVLAHEVAHIKHRDPLRGMGRGVIAGLGLSLVSAGAGNAVLDSAMAQGVNLSVLKYSREQEQAADATALQALVSLYGQVDGAEALFEVLQREQRAEPSLAFFSSHPLTAERLAQVRAALHHGTAPTPLPANFKQWLAASPAGQPSPQQ